MNVAYRWFLGYTMADSFPYFATISYNFKHWFTEETIEGVFRWVLREHTLSWLGSGFLMGRLKFAAMNLKKICPPCCEMLPFC